MQKRNAIYQRLFESANAPIIIIDADFRITECNNMALELLERSKHEITGKTPIDISPENQRNGKSSLNSGKEFFSAAMKGVDMQFEWIHLKKDGSEVIVEVSLFGFMASGRKNFFAMWRDLTEKKKQQAELDKYKSHLQDLVEQRTAELNTALKHLRKTQDKLIQSEKKSSLGILTSGVAHEINNPLNYIMGGYAGISNELDEKGSVTKEDVAIFLDGIKIGVDRAACIVKGLNQLSRDKGSNDEDCDIHSILDNCLGTLQIGYMKQIELVKDFCDRESAKTKGNARKLYQAFKSIILNAIDSINEKGRVSIITRNKNGAFEIAIEDTGCGIPKRNINKVFDPFYTTKAPGQGTGLGLSIANTIIQGHGGRIVFKSQEQVGTRVNIQLPKKMKV